MNNTIPHRLGDDEMEAVIPASPEMIDSILSIPTNEEIDNLAYYHLRMIKRGFRLQIWYQEGSNKWWAGYLIKESQSWPNGIESIMDKSSKESIRFIDNEAPWLPISHNNDETMVISGLMSIVQTVPKEYFDSWMEIVYAYQCSMLKSGELKTSLFDESVLDIMAMTPVNTISELDPGIKDILKMMLCLAEDIYKSFGVDPDMSYFMDRRMNPDFWVRVSVERGGDRAIYSYKWKAGSVLDYHESKKEALGDYIFGVGDMNTRRMSAFRRKLNQIKSEMNSQIETDTLNAFFDKVGWETIFDIMLSTMSDDPTDLAILNTWVDWIYS